MCQLRTTIFVFDLFQAKWLVLKTVKSGLQSTFVLYIVCFLIPIFFFAF